eukprot:892866-Pyramimonas_sp.AAC.1
MHIVITAWAIASRTRAASRVPTSGCAALPALPAPCDYQADSDIVDSMMYEMDVDGYPEDDALR